MCRCHCFLDADSLPGYTRRENGTFIPSDEVASQAYVPLGKLFLPHDDDACRQLSSPSPWSMHLQVPADICQSQGQQASIEFLQARKSAAQQRKQKPRSSTVRKEPPARTPPLNIVQRSEIVPPTLDSSHGLLPRGDTVAEVAQDAAETSTALIAPLFEEHRSEDGCISCDPERSKIGPASAFASTIPADMKRAEPTVTDSIIHIPSMSSRAAAACLEESGSAASPVCALQSLTPCPPPDERKCEPDCHRLNPNSDFFCCC